ncbi:hypothetical protein PRIC2_010034 [Phytophthora ramorum]
MSSGYVRSGQVDRLTGYLMQFLRQVQHELPSESSETHYGGSSSEFPTGCRRTTLSRSYALWCQTSQRHRTPSPVVC